MHHDAPPSTHEHVFLGAQHEANERRTLWVVALTALMMVGEIVAGVIYGSMALLADGFHMATHAGALGVAAIAYGYARRHARDPRFSFGTGKVGELAGFASALALAIVAAGIGVESVQRFFTPQTVAFTQATVVALIGLAVNLISALMLSGGQHHGHDHGHGHDHRHGHHHAHRDGHDHHGHDDHHHAAHQDNNLRAAYFHVLADALTSVLAIIALLAGRFMGWVWMDPAMGVVGALVIGRWSWRLARDSATVLLDTADPRLAEAVRRRIESDGDARITDLHVWRVGPGAHATIVSLVADSPLDADGYRARLADLDLAHVTVEATTCAGPHRLRAVA